ncbi:MAG TPA: ATP-binding protein [Kineosporiaceae bacterium]|nr:ATP-binding protein [Kineosporiaceae bacterium]
MRKPTMPAALHPSRWTLRTRLVVTQLALMAAVSLVIGLASVLTLNHFLLGRLDEQLASATRLTSRVDRDSPQGEAEGPPSPSQTGQSGQGGPGGDHVRPPLPPAAGIGALSARIPAGGSGEGSVSTVENEYVVGQALPATVLRHLGTVPVDGRSHLVHLESLGDYLVMADNHTVDGATLVVGLPLAQVEETTGALSLIVTGVALAGLVAVALAGTVTVRMTLRPLHRVAATARRVAQLPLDRGEVALAVRVPEADTDDRTEVGQVGHALNRMLEHVADALQVRQDSEMRVRRFVSDASHELRTPLASIRGYAELTRRSRSEVAPDVAYALERVESEAQRMTDLVEELLLLARLDEGRPLEREPVDLTQLVVDATSDAHVAGAGHRWRLDLPEEPVSVLGDRHRLHQVIANLLTNARTHTPAGTTVTLSLAAGGGVAQIRVADDGPGVPPELLPEVFDRFARADTSRSRAAGSTGLGLAIVQAVARAHGGRVTVASRPGETVFTVLLPLDPAGDGTGDGPGDRSSAGEPVPAPTG